MTDVDWGEPRNVTEPDDMSDFAPRKETFGLKPDGGDPLTRTVFVSKRKDADPHKPDPAVIIIHEIPGITPQVLRFARWVRNAGFTVYLPSLFGNPGQPVDGAYSAVSIARCCIAREFHVLASDHHSPIVEWLKRLAAKVHGECGGKGVGALGMCITGNFAMSMMIEPAVRAPVLCQPSLPFGHKGGIHASCKDVVQVRDRLEREDLTVKGYRFKGDDYSKPERFDDYRAVLGDRFDGDQLDDKDAKKDGVSKNPHSVVTTHLIFDPVNGSVTMDKVREIIAFFKLRLT